MSKINSDFERRFVNSSFLKRSLDDVFGKENSSDYYMLCGERLLEEADKISFGLETIMNQYEMMEDVNKVLNNALKTSLENLNSSERNAVEKALLTVRSIESNELLSLEAKAKVVVATPAKENIFKKVIRYIVEAFKKFIAAIVNFFKGIFEKVRSWFRSFGYKRVKEFLLKAKDVANANKKMTISNTCGIPKSGVNKKFIQIVNGIPKNIKLLDTSFANMEKDIKSFLGKKPNLWNVTGIEFKLNSHINNTQSIVKKLAFNQLKGSAQEKINLILFGSMKPKPAQIKAIDFVNNIIKSKIFDTNIDPLLVQIGNSMTAMTSKLQNITALFQQVDQAASKTLYPKFATALLNKSFKVMSGLVREAIAFYKSSSVTIWGAYMKVGKVIVGIAKQNPKIVTTGKTITTNHNINIGFGKRK